MSLTPLAINIKLFGCAAAGVPRCQHKQLHRHSANILEQHDTGKPYYPCRPLLSSICEGNAVTLQLYVEALQCVVAGATFGYE